MEIKNPCPYFQAHTIVILSSYSIRAILHKPDALRRLLKWAIELSEFDIVYYPRSAIKGQVHIDFIVELSYVSKDNIPKPLWILETNGSSKAVGGRAGIVLQSLEGLLISQAIKFSFPISNNKVEYKVVLLVLQVAKALSITSLELMSLKLIYF